MKKYLLSAVLMISSLSFAQTINDIPLKDLDVNYVQIIGTSKMLSNKLTITIDIGQHVKLIQFNDKNTVLKDEKGERIEFNSMIDALNFMKKAGYKYIDSNALLAGNGFIYTYILEKE